MQWSPLPLTKDQHRFTTLKIFQVRVRLSGEWSTTPNNWWKTLSRYWMVFNPSAPAHPRPSLQINHSNLACAGAVSHMISPSLFFPLFLLSLLSSSQLPPSSFCFLSQNVASFAQNNNNELSDAARWPAQTPEGTESHSSTPTDNPPAWSQPSHFHQWPSAWCGTAQRRGCGGGDGSRLLLSTCSAPRYFWEVRGLRESEKAPKKKFESLTPLKDTKRQLCSGVGARVFSNLKVLPRKSDKS